jgi:polar amino acid transport system substrate-binding protein
MSAQYSRPVRFRPSVISNLSPRTSRRRAIVTLMVAFSLASPQMSRASAPDRHVPSVIRIASEGARPPYNYLDGNELAGFEIDLGNALCAQMSVTCNFVTQDWDNLVPGLIKHRYDAIMAAVEITDEAQAKIAFSTPYVRMPSAFFAAKDSGPMTTAPSALAGKKIGVVSESAHETYARSQFEQSVIVPYGSLEEAILDLAEGRLDLVLDSKDVLSDFSKSRREAQCCAFVGDVAHDPAYFGKGIGIGFRRDDTKLRQNFDKALSDLRANGTYAKIRAKYFDFVID